jgi:hypothetical protein
MENLSKSSNSGEEVKNEKDIWYIVLFGFGVAMAIEISGIDYITLIRGITEIVLCLLSFRAYNKSQSPTIQQALTIVMGGLLILGLYDLYVAFR